jgi:hypothetical protein
MNPMTTNDYLHISTTKNFTLDMSSLTIIIIELLYINQFHPKIYADKEEWSTHLYFSTPLF